MYIPRGLCFCKPNRVSPSECVMLNNALLKKKEISICFHLHVCWHLVTVSCYLLDRDFRTVTCLENIRLTIIWEYPDTCHSIGVFIYPYTTVASLSLDASTPSVFPSPNTCSDRATLSSSFHKRMRT